MELRWNDTRGDTVLATRAMTEMICDGIATFFGPEGPCYVEAIVSQSRNIPMISYVSIDYNLFFFHGKLRYQTLIVLVDPKATLLPTQKLHFIYI